MKQILFLAILLSIITGCKKNEDLNFVINKFKERSNLISKIDYKAQKSYKTGIDTIVQEGYALIERDEEDTIFGFSFYGKRNDFHKEHIYYKGDGFEFNNKSKRFEIEYNTGTWFLGKPGGQMILPQIFKLDSVYEKVELIDNKSNYIIKYKFKNDTIYNITDKVKIVELDKNSFIPVRITFSANQDGILTFSQLALTDIRINNEVKNSIDVYRNKLNDYTLIKEEEEPEPNKLLKKELPKISLKNLMDESATIEIKTNQLTLIDFWEDWCGPCVASLPKVEKIKNKFSSNLNVIGIISQDKEKAKTIVEQKGITFLNLIGNNELKKVLSVNSYPRYFLVDNKGIIQKEYHGFSEQIEKDIQELISK